MAKIQRCAEYCVIFSRRLADNFNLNSKVYPANSSEFCCGPQTLLLIKRWETSKDPLLIILAFRFSQSTDCPQGIELSLHPRYRRPCNQVKVSNDENQVSKILMQLKLGTIYSDQTNSQLRILYILLKWILIVFSYLPHTKIIY